MYSLHIIVALSSICGGRVRFKSVVSDVRAAEVSGQKSKDRLWRRHYMPFNISCTPVNPLRLNYLFKASNEFFLGSLLCRKSRKIIVEGKCLDSGRVWPKTLVGMVSCQAKILGLRASENLPRYFYLWYRRIRFLSNFFLKYIWVPMVRKRMQGIDKSKTVQASQFRLIRTLSHWGGYWRPLIGSLGWAVMKVGQETCWQRVRATGKIIT